ncbi:MAG TPA: selenium-dependent molybdenum cofactor biosynthesis protein YqeB [Symbiobacteriaceae bacterium]|jgi:xanthine dehydrogenase accessory factor|nr:selenium-dependent molybdenum cofactor biosynthesis protein YqeB [Symbiobacteriaceae bacterium]
MNEPGSLVLVRGAGEIASGIAWRLFRCGFPVVLTEADRPLAVRRTVAFCEAVHDGSTTVEGVDCLRVDAVGQVPITLSAGAIPLLVDPGARSRRALRPAAVVDAIMAKRNLGTAIHDAPIVVGVGPGFTAGADCHAVVETQRGHGLGRVYYQGAALADTGVPAERGGHSTGRVVRAPADGAFAQGAREIGDTVRAGDLLGHVDGRPVLAAIDGLLRGLIRDGTPVTAGLKIGDIDPLGDVARCFTISDKALAVAGGVLEALLVLRNSAQG